jgi:heterodisulfide reductase subunit A-like polyferredoxin
MSTTAANMEINPEHKDKESPNLANKRPLVIIIGAGIAGLSLAMLLEKTDIPYLIFERAAAVKPLGKDLSLVFQDKCTKSVFFGCSLVNRKPFP